MIRLTAPRLALLLTLSIASFASFSLIRPSEQASAAGEPIPEFWQRCDENALQSQRCQNAMGVAANPSNGHIYVADSGHRRVIEFDAWGEFLRAWGWDVVATGPGDTVADEFEVCVPADGDTCKSGIEGSGAGQFQSGGSLGVALDASGDVYVVDSGEPSNRRVQKFSPTGQFLLMFGGAVNQGGGTPANPGDVCTAAHLANGDTCGAGTQGTAPGEFGAWPHGSTFIAIDPNDRVYVGDENRIQRFDTSGVYQAEIAVPGETVKGLAVDPNPPGNLYVTYATSTDASAPAKPNVHRLSPAGADLGTVTVGNPTALATDPDGNLYVADDLPGNGNPQLVIRRFSAAGQATGTWDINSTTRVGNLEVAAGGLAASPVTGSGDVALYYVNRGFTQYLRAYSPAPDPSIVGDPPLKAPTIDASFAGFVESTTATLSAAINSYFWADTTYYLEYGLADCAANPCTRVGFPGLPLNSGVTDSPTSVDVDLAGLDPATTYHFRFIAESSGGGPTVGPDRTFTTYGPEPAPRTDCPNQAFRTGAGARLPDCRAYEMVTPLDKNGVGPDAAANVARYQSSLDGDKLTYSSSVAFADAQAAGYTVQYLASRSDSGWSSHGIDPQQGENGYDQTTNPFEAFSEDLSRAWLFTRLDPQPDPTAVSGYQNLYERNNLTDGYAALTTVTPPSTPATQFHPRLFGRSEDGQHIVFGANDRLVPGASNAVRGDGLPIIQLYEREGGQLRLVSRLPNGSASGQDSFSPLANKTFPAGAVSEDGSRIYWTTGSVVAYGGFGNYLLGKIYLRLNGSTTVPVSETVSSEPAHFWGAASDGSAALFSIDSDLYRFDLATQTSTLLGSGFGPSVFPGGGVAGSSEDLSRSYVVSTDVLDPSPNSEGDTAQAGQWNIYLYQQGSGFTFIASGEPTAVNAASSPHSPVPQTRSAHVSPDGRYLVFLSRDPLTGFDNTDAASGESDLEVYRYAADEDELSCLSCNPAGARPRGKRFSEGGNDSARVSREWLAADIPGWRNGAFHQLRALSDDGTRVYFESVDRLLPRDTNHKLDVYQWQAPNSGECTTASAHYFEANEGCLELISTGQSDTDSDFVDATPDGSTVFFRTTERLVDADTDSLLDIYAARVGGGFPAPPEPPMPCSGDACQGDQATAPPPSQSDSSQGSGNVTPPDCTAEHKAVKKAKKKLRKAERNGDRKAKKKAKRKLKKAKRKLEACQLGADQRTISAIPGGER